jgi:Ca2+/Na+ antiporter
MGPELLLDVVLIKCEHRAQQIGVVVGMAVFIIACVAIGLWMLNMGHATLSDYRSLDSSGSNRDHGLGRIMVYFYAGAGISGALTLLFSLVGIVNLVRLLTGTGLKEPKAW